MQQRLFIASLCQSLKLDPFYGDNRRSFRMAMCLRQKLLPPLMTFKFIDLHCDGETAPAQPSQHHGPLLEASHGQLQLIHVCCGLAYLPTYEHGKNQPTGWYCWDYEVKALQKTGASVQKWLGIFCIEFGGTVKFFSSFSEF